MTDVKRYTAAIIRGSNPDYDEVTMVPNVIGSYIKYSDYKEAEAEIERLKNELGDPEGVIAHADAISAEGDRLSARVGELERLLARVPGAMNGYFSAGIEECEGGSARRQEKLMADGEALIREIRDFLTSHKEGDND